MSKLLRAVAALPILLAAVAAPALADSPSFGVSFGGGPSGQLTTPAGTINTNYQWASGAYWRAEPLPFSEARIGILSRGQALSVNRDTVFETSGLSLAFGAKAWFLRAGVGGELSLLRSIVPDAANPGTLRFHNGAGIVIEPYVGVALPFLQSEFSELELTVHYPVYKMLENSIGPRVMLTMWLGAPGKDDDEEEEETEPDMDGKDGEPDPDEDDGKNDEEMRPTPKPTPSPSAAPPTPKPKPMPRG